MTIVFRPPAGFVQLVPEHEAAPNAKVKGQELAELYFHLLYPSMVCTALYAISKMYLYLYWVKGSSIDLCVVFRKFW